MAAEISPKTTVLKINTSSLTPEQKLQPIFITSPDQKLAVGDTLLLSPISDQQKILTTTQIPTLQPVTSTPATATALPVVNNVPLILPNGTYLTTNNSGLLSVLPQNATNSNTTGTATTSPAAVAVPQGIDVSQLLSSSTNNALNLALAQQQQNAAGNQQSLLTLFNQLLTAVSLQQAINANQQQQTLINQLVQHNTNVSMATTTAQSTPATMIQIKTEPGTENSNQFTPVSSVKQERRDSGSSFGSYDHRTPSRGLRRCKKDHVCPYCGKVCVRKDYLTKHIRIHTKEKPYTCDKCGQRFTQKGSLNAHVNYNCRGVRRIPKSLLESKHASNHVLKRLKELQERNRLSAMKRAQYEIDASSLDEESENGDRTTDYEETDGSSVHRPLSLKESMKLPLGPPDISSTDGGLSTNPQSDASSEDENSADDTGNVVTVTSADTKTNNEPVYITVKSEPLDDEDDDVAMIEVLPPASDETTVPTMLPSTNTNVTQQQNTNLQYIYPTTLSSQNATIAQMLGHFTVAKPLDQGIIVHPPAGKLALPPLPAGSPGRPRNGRYKRTHNCPYCGKVFARRDYLTKHIRIHTKERPYVCNLCGDRFTQKGTLNSHLNCHKSTGTFFCDVCNVRFASKRSLSKHQQSHTRGPEEAVLDPTPMKVAQWMATMNCSIVDCDPNEVEELQQKTRLLAEDDKLLDGFGSGYLAECFSAHFDENRQQKMSEIESLVKKSARNSRKQSMPMRVSTDTNSDSVEVINLAEEEDDDCWGSGQQSDDNISSCEFVVTSNGIRRRASSDSSSCENTQTKKRKLGSLIDKISQNAREHSPSPGLIVPKTEPKTTNRRKSHAPAYRIANAQMESFDDEVVDDEEYSSDLSNGRKQIVDNIIDEVSSNTAVDSPASAASIDISETEKSKDLKETGIIDAVKIKVEVESSDENEVMTPLTLELPEADDKSPAKIEKLVSPRKNTIPILEQIKMELDDDKLMSEDVSSSLGEVKADGLESSGDVLTEKEDSSENIPTTVTEIAENNNNVDDIITDIKQEVKDNDELDGSVDETVLTCPVCFEISHVEREFCAHLKTHREKDLKCPLCGRYFQNEDRWLTHMKQHSQGELCKCEICGQMLAQKRYLKVHMRTHTKERPYLCTICNKAFTQKGSLNEHMRSHARRASKRRLTKSF